MADSHLNAYDKAVRQAIRTKVIPLLIEPLSADRKGLDLLNALLKLYAEEPDSHDDWRDLNARPAG